MTGGAAELFERSHGREPDGVWAAPGRVNLIGEHTDYNEGFVMPLALDKRCVAAVGRARAGRSTATSSQRPDEPVRFVAAELEPGAVTGWAAYVAGVVWSLRAAGHDVPDVDVVVDSDVPLGASLSSSAALECSVALALSDLHGLGLDRTGVALAAQRAENDFVGMPCGALDQLASMHGRAGHAVFMDTRSLSMEPVPFDVTRHGLRLLVIDTRAPHALVDGEYAARRRDCERAAAVLGVDALRDVGPGDLDAALQRLDEDVLRRRVRHVVTEDARVLELAAAMRTGDDPRDVGPLLTASHVSLRDDYEVTVPHLDVAVDAALAAGAHGARMTGGGFGGSIIALVDADAAERIVEAVEAAYTQRGFIPPVAFDATPADGASRLV
ncbi:galactokinase [Agilicoccus flavus]|uniref:galactokinase n=1 Tax=Agilicoccus flavus TaxID=2775968 RepID=UPI001CF66228|nr:galactokinase [Agilicoccus flavus]